MSKEEQPVWDEFLERMEETFKEYLDNFSINQDKLAEQFKDILMDIDFDKIFKEYLENLDIGYVIQNFLERFNLEVFPIKRKEQIKEDKKIDLDKAFEFISLIENFNEANVEELKVLEVYPFLNNIILQLRKALGDE